MPTLELEVRRASFAPSTWNAEARTVEAVISTGADVERRDAKGPYIERLDLSGIDPASLIGLPILRDHAQSVGSTVGVIAAARREGGDLVALIRFSAAVDAQDTVTKVAEGVLRGVSIGYGLTHIRETTEAGRRVRTITPKIREASLTPIPADAASLIRSNTDMPTPIVQDVPAIVAPPAVVAAGAVETRAAVNAQIRAMAETAGLDRSWADAQIDAESDIGAARAAAFEAMAARSAPAAGIRAHVGASHEDPTVIAERQAEALAQRMGGAEASEAARPYIGLGFTDYARQALVRAGERVDNLSADAILTRAMQTTSDFPLLLEQGGNRVLSTAYAAAESPLKAIAVRREVSDLRDVTVAKLGEGSGLEKVSEAGEITYGSFGEGAESYKVETFGKLFNLSRKLLLNDQFGAFGDVMRQMGQLAAAAEASALVGMLAAGAGAGPAMSDGKRLFHADHGNLAATGAAPSIATLSDARLALRSQKGLDGVTPVGVTPTYFVVGPALETVAEQLLATLAATKSADVNPFSGTLQLIVEPRITGLDWYIFGDKANAPVLEMAYLAGASGPQILSRDGWNTLGREYRVTLDLGVGATDWRGAYRNPGA
ncbi:prohead protease/major capsid protein fusion protein [Brevundimonas faecalis]|uniref:Phage major head subunit gpT-like protein n=1 Tax=Brevundimonas faecalis TaxID=947378 RepID=A0ABV2RE81_9CAUL